MKSHLAKLGLALILAGPLGACALADVASAPAPQLFTLTAAHPVPPAGPGSTPAQLQVEQFGAPAAIDTTRIVYQASPNELKYYADARWSDTAPKMIQTLTIETLENSGGFGAVSPRGADLNADYSLMGDVRQFAAEAGEGGKETSVRIDLFVRLVSIDDRTIIAAKDFNTAIPVAGSGISSIVAAYDAGLRQTLDEITLWTLAETAKAPRKTSSAD